MHIVKFCTLIFCLILVGGRLSAQNYYVETDINGVLPMSNLVYDIGQDHIGQIWFSTSRGVSYSDGFQTFDIPDSINNKLSAYSKIREDEDGIIWVYSGSSLPVAFYLKGGKWYEVPFEAQDFKYKDYYYLEFAVGYVGEQKQIAVGRTDEVKVFDTAGNLLYGVDLSNRSVSNNDFLKNLSFYRGELYLGTDEGLFKIKDGQLSKPLLDLSKTPNTIVKSWKIHERSAKWYVLGNDWLGEFKDGQLIRILDQGFYKSFLNTRSYTKLSLVDDQLYYIDNSYVRKYNLVTNEKKFVSLYTSMKAAYVNNFFIDRENSLWMATSRGIGKLQSFRFQYFNKDNGLIDDEVSAILELGPDEFLLGSNFGYMFMKDGMVQESQLISDIASQSADKRIINFVKDDDGVIWFSANNSGLGRINQKRQLTWHKPANNEPVSFVDYKDGKLYIATSNNVYLVDNPNELNRLFETPIVFPGYNDQQENFRNFIRRMGVLSDGRIILLHSPNINIKESPTIHNGLILMEGYTFLETDDGILLGNENGLFIYNGVGIKEFRLNDFSVDRPVYALMRTKRGEIWIGTDRGVYVIGVENRISHYTGSRGLIGDEVNRSALIEDSQGRVLIGTEKGVALYDPSEQLDGDASPNVSIKYMQTDAKTIFPLNENQRLSYQENSLDFHFNVISFDSERRLRYYYKLEGYDQDWQTIEIPQQNFVRYTNLPPGDYKFFLKASLDNNLMSEVVSSANIRIARPVYLQTWFLLSVIGFFLLLGYATNSLLNQKKNESKLKYIISEKVEEIQGKELQFRAVWNSTQDAISLSTVDGVYVSVNPSFCELTGLSEQALIGQPYQIIFKDPEFAKTIQIPELNRKEVDAKVAFQTLAPYHSGEKYIEGVISILEIPGFDEPLVMSVIRDVSERKAYETDLIEARDRAEESNRLKSNFLANMSHEIRTPINGIIGMTELLLVKNEHNPELKDNLNDIIQSSERLLDTINAILNLSKIESNRMSIKFELLDITDIVAKVLVPMKALAFKKGLLLSAKYERRPIEIPTDRYLLEMILNNLIGNAVKYTDEGMVQVQVFENAANVIIEIKDTGIGISEEFQKNLFKPFMQESMGLDRKYEGTGLGLSIAKRLIDLINASIEVSSVKGQGSTFRLIIPSKA